MCDVWLCAGSLAACLGVFVPLLLPSVEVRSTSTDGSFSRAEGWQAPAAQHLFEVLRSVDWDPGSRARFSICRFIEPSMKQSFQRCANSVLWRLAVNVSALGRNA